MDLKIYLLSKVSEVKEMFASRKIQIGEDQLNRLFDSILHDANGMFWVVDLIQGFVDASEEIAEQIEEEFSERILFPRYAEFLKHNEDLSIKEGAGQENNKDDESSKIDKSDKDDKKSPRASFYFSSEDEEEIRKVMEHGTWNMEQMEKIYERVAGEVVEKVRIENRESRIEEEDEERKNKRLKNIIVSRLKDTRDPIEVKEFLAKPWKIGGMEFSGDEAGLVVREIEKAREALQEELRVENRESRIETVKSSEAPYRSFQQSYIRHVEELSEPEIEAPRDERLAFSVQGAGQEIVKKVKAQDRSLPAHRSTLNPLAGKPAVDSVVSSIPSAFSKPKLMGPVEELSAMTVEDFRKLGSTVDAVRKIHDKVELLAADSLLEKKKGIDAWKRSEVYKLYMLVGTESLEKRMGIGEVASLRQKQQLPTLTSEEFSAVADLNRNISFSS